MLSALSRRALMLNAAALSGLAACGTTSTQTAETQSDALGDLDATGVAARVRSGEITASEALEAAIARANRVQPQLNFMAAEAYEYGRALAATPRTGPFAGVPTLIKDLMALRGVPLRYGSRAFANNVAAENPPYVEALQAAGLVPFGKSTTPEFGFTATTEPIQGGITRNPWDTNRSSGGSSGGAGVAVAARVVPIAHASDGGGSIRIPASCNGLVGLKNSRNRDIVVSRPEDTVSLSVNGCVSHSVRDTAAWLAVTERQGENRAYPPVGMVTGPNTRRLRIALQVADARGRDPSGEVRTATESVAELCRSLGHEVREGHPNINGADFADAFTLLWAAGAAEVVQEVRQAAPDAPLDQLLEPLTLELAQHFATQPEGALRGALEKLRAAAAAYAAFFADTDVLLTPVLGSVPPVIGEISPTLGMAGFARVEAYVGYTPLQNVAGAPALSLPLSWSPGGLPIGAHFSAAPGAERTLLELAYELEQARPWAGRRPPVSAG